MWSNLGVYWRGEMVGLGMVEKGGFLMNKSCQELSILNIKWCIYMLEKLGYEMGKKGQEYLSKWLEKRPFFASRKWRSPWRRPRVAVAIGSAQQLLKRA